jgi:hypothetical protein
MPALDELWPMTKTWLALTMKRFLKALPYLAALLFGLKGIGVDPIAPGPDVDFSWGEGLRHGRQGLVLSTDKGDLNCFLQMKVRSRDARGFSAELSDGTPLQVRADAYRGAEAWRIIVSGPSPSAQRTKFTWPAGLEVFLALPDQRLTSEMVEDWRIYLDKDQYDSKGRELRRTLWNGFSILLLGVLLVSAFKREKPPEQSSFTAEVCIGRIIDGIESSSEEETARIKKFLSDVVLEGASVREALEATGLSQKAQQAFFFKAKRAFLDRLNFLIERLSFFRERFP